MIAIAAVGVAALAVAALAATHRGVENAAILMYWSMVLLLVGEAAKWTSRYVWSIGLGALTRNP